MHWSIDRYEVPQLKVYAAVEYSFLMYYLSDTRRVNRLNETTSRVSAGHIRKKLINITATRRQWVILRLGSSPLVFSFSICHFRLNRFDGRRRANVIFFFSSIVNHRSYPYNIVCTHTHAHTHTRTRYRRLKNTCRNSIRKIMFW